MKVIYSLQACTSNRSKLVIFEGYHDIFEVREWSIAGSQQCVYNIPRVKNKSSSWMIGWKSSKRLWRARGLISFNYATIILYQWSRSCQNQEKEGGRCRPVVAPGRTDTLRFRRPKRLLVSSAWNGQPGWERPKVRVKENIAVKSRHAALWSNVVARDNKARHHKHPGQRKGRMKLCSTFGKRRGWLLFEHSGTAGIMTGAGHDNPTLL